jgi:ketosteroid isomerase-like protein
MLFILLCIASLQTDFDSRYRDYADAVRKMDVNRYMAYFADDFSMRSPDGKLHDKAEMTRYQQINAKTTKRVNAYTADVECVRELPNGDIAVIVLQKYDRDQAPLEQPDKPHNIRTSVVQRETWRKTASGWRIRSTEELLVGPVFFDGKMQTQ